MLGIYRLIRNCLMVDKFVNLLSAGQFSQVFFLRSEELGRHQADLRVEVVD
jgi:hypothetical protein